MTDRRILGVGIDLCELDRIEKIWERMGERFLERVYTPQEINYICAEEGQEAIRCAGFFAAKEAVVKCLGTGFSCGVGWKQVEIGNKESNRPLVESSANSRASIWMVHLHGEAARRAAVYGENHWQLDLDYDRHHAIAIALWLGS